MLASIVRFVSSCWRAAADYGNDAQSDLLSAQDIGRHGYGDFSSASLQANQLNEDCFQVEASPPFGGVFIGIYDGHGGPEASRFIQDRLFPHLTSKFPVLVSSSLFFDLDVCSVLLYLSFVVVTPRYLLAIVFMFSFFFLFNFIIIFL